MPSDIAAGLALLHQQQDNVTNSQEPGEVISHSPGDSQVSLNFCWIDSFDIHTSVLIFKDTQSAKAVSVAVGLESDLRLLLVLYHLSGEAAPHLESRRWEPILSQFTIHHIFKALCFRKFTVGFSVPEKFLLGWDLNLVPSSWGVLSFFSGPEGQK